MKANYSAWNIDFAEGESAKSNIEKVRFVLRFGILAPSLHNVQPWKFKLFDDRVKVYLNEDRLIRESDPTLRESYISLGCCAQNIVEAAQICGMNAVVNINNIGKDVKDIEIIFNNFSRFLVQQPSLQNIINRRSNRTRYQSPHLSSDDCDLIEKSYQSPSSRIIVSNDQKVNELIVSLSIKAMNIAFHNPSFRNDLAKLIRNNWTRKSYGMPGFTTEVRGLPSLFLPTSIKLGRSMSKQIKKEEIAMRSAAAYILVFSQGDMPKDWIEAGRAYQASVLKATEMSLSNSTHAACVEAMDFHTLIEKYFSTNNRLQTVVRIGYSNKIPRHSPRYSLDQSIA